MYLNILENLKKFGSLEIQMFESMKIEILKMFET